MDFAEDKGSYDARKKKWDKDKDEFNEEIEEGKHILSAFSNKARLYRYVYRKNGYFYIDKKRKKLYNKTIPILRKRLREMGRKTRSRTYKTASVGHAKVYKYKYSGKIKRGGVGETVYNFLYASWPYRNEAHHLLPVGVFSGKKPAFSDEQLELMYKLPYDINHGQNIIFLPRYLRDSPIHMLPIHRKGDARDHKAYNDMVFIDVKEISNDLKVKGKKVCEPEELPDVMGQFVSLQDEYWNTVVNWGVGKSIHDAAKEETIAVDEV